MTADSLTMALGDRIVGGREPCYVIAEAGSNHNRDLGIAQSLIDVAADAGADAVKFQTYSGSRIYSTKTPAFGKLAETSDRTPSELLEDISLPREWQAPLAEHARQAGVDFFSSPFDIEAVEELAAIGVPVIKIASFEIVDPVLISAAAATGIPLIISTGMATLGEIEYALEAARNAGAESIGLMECTSSYPAAPETINLRAMDTMRAAFGVPVGLSDHTTGTAVAIAAAARGAAFVEKHLTLSREMHGPDHSFAVEPDELAVMIAGIREAHSALGDGRKRGPGPAEIESGNYRFGRRSLVIVGDHPAGTALSREMVTIKRPGFGIAPKDLQLVLGRKLRLDVTDDEILTWEMV